MVLFFVPITAQWHLFVGQICVLRLPLTLECSINTPLIPYLMAFCFSPYYQRRRSINPTMAADNIHRYKKIERYQLNKKRADVNNIGAIDCCTFTVGTVLRGGRCYRLLCCCHTGNRGWHDIAVWQLWSECIIHEPVRAYNRLCVQRRTGACSHRTHYIVLGCIYPQVLR